MNKLRTLKPSFVFTLLLIRSHRLPPTETRESHTEAACCRPSAHLDGAVVKLVCPDLRHTELQAVELGLVSGVGAICEKQVKGHLGSDTTSPKVTARGLPGHRKRQRHTNSQLCLLSLKVPTAVIPTYTFSSDSKHCRHPRPRPGLCW